MSNLFVLNIFLAVGFSVILGQFNLSGLTAGFIVGYLALWVTRPLYGPNTYFSRVGKVLQLVFYFIRELLISNLRVLWDVITPGHISKPGVIAVPLDAKSDFEIMMVANLVSLTPGTLSLDVSDDRKTLYVHVMFLDDVETARRDIKQGIEKKVLEALR
ncbi:MAG: Na+/H+ antiporter subunit E [Thermodesulfobacteriota bacterium]|nr:Na+/H+ antiporter subunit E [Thermodesulfobacteriota bacterium]